MSFNSVCYANFCIAIMLMMKVSNVLNFSVLILNYKWNKSEYIEVARIELYISAIKWKHICL